ncbi:FMN-dependent dehydrogenase-domain-containing protein [Fomitopsis serialis]|uniref:FMN-dependent dehydrogenase-domain-containing protein n=1 Tax=Fomitopsis serialis TaxID=139415 RepID=UPI00200841D5|nr:FMN-dependent dehydrogenase-domain-containing protein [Neoantrodia serialis]KAH9937553.1 FMN-dependent dehydrogenase-domain-containing protein [Neoantrodia serialis]
MPLSLEEVAQHNSIRSCWVIIKNRVYDVTEFLPEHPGGAKIILKYAGRDATTAYEPIHPPDALDKNLPPEKHLGELNIAGTAALQKERETRKKTKDEIRVEQAQADVAMKVMSHKAMAYYSSAADDETTHRENARAFSRFFFHPRILRPISKVDVSTTILGIKSSIPVFVSGAALAKLGHPLGEVNITKGAGRTGIIQMVSSNASLSPSQIAEGRLSPSQPLFFQLYKHGDNSIAQKRVREVEQLGYRAIFLTVDAPVSGNRERDIRAPYDLEEQEREGEPTDGQTAGEMPRQPDDVEKEIEGQQPNLYGTAGALLQNMDLDMTFKETIPWLRSVTKLPIALKVSRYIIPTVRLMLSAIQDAVLAAEAGVDAILLSNHGGDSLPPLEVLYKIRQQRPDLFNKLESMFTGFTSRASHVLKALCLGAKAVGMGRPFLYAQSAYGEAGVVQAVRILQREIILGMRLLGVTSVDQLVPELVERVDWQPLLARL